MRLHFLSLKKLINGVSIKYTEKPRLNFQIINNADEKNCGKGNHNRDGSEV